MSFDSSRSNSSSSRRSKRSFNSLNSANSNSNRSTKKKTNQKTLGVAWGSNSLASSRSSSRKAPFSDFGSYMIEKNRKLHDQFHNEASSSSPSGKPIFHGVSIFVDGFTVPSSQELRGYMLKHGGRFENYFSRHSVTHIICSNLPDSKIRNLRAFSCGLPVVKPTWILDSVASNKLLSWVPYQLEQVASNQSKVSDFFALGSSKRTDGCWTGSFCQVEFDAEDSTLNITESKDTSRVDDGRLADCIRGINSEIDGFVCKNDNGTAHEEPNHDGIPIENDFAKENNLDTEDKSSHIEIELESDKDRSSIHSYCSEEQSLKRTSSSGLVGPSSHCHSTLSDPNFVENYFKSSRLHFIGTWRSRYRKRFPSISNELSLGSSFNSRRNVIIHIDMDCFFVSVVIRNHPELQNKPVAVCHSNNPKGTAEISSANYPARNYGVKAGIFVRDAKAMCPHLVILPYNFEAYEEVADQFYTILHKHFKKVQAVSCDEAFLDISDLEGEDPELLASFTRKEIFGTTGCTASAGIAGNMLMARLATRTAKPNGQYYIPHERVDDYLSQLPINALPGIGHVLEKKLNKQNVHTCGQLRLLSKDALQKDFGQKTGETLWNYSRGMDNRHVGLIQESKSIGAEVNWGVRFKDVKESEHFLLQLCKEVSLRLVGYGVQGRTFTLKIKKRRTDAGEPAKYMGCGDCENLSHSASVPLATDNPEVIQRITKQLFGSFHIDTKEIRGMGLQVSKLESAETSIQGGGRNSLKLWFTSLSTSTEQKTNDYEDKRTTNAENMQQNMEAAPGQSPTKIVAPPKLNNCKISNREAPSNSTLAPPPICHLDLGVVQNLPPELISELNEVYEGKLVDFIAKGKAKVEDSTCSSNHSPQDPKADEKREFHLGDLALQNKTIIDNKATKKADDFIEASCSEARFFNTVHESSLEEADLMPSSLSQVDVSVLQNLPEDLRDDIIRQLPVHRRKDFSSATALELVYYQENSLETTDVQIPENYLGLTDDMLKTNLWAGNPPLWVDKFKISKCLLLNNFAEVYYKTGMNGTLSLILLRIISKSHNLVGENLDCPDEIMNILCELFKQYIKLKIENNIEEIHICFRLLKRFASKSPIFQQVYNIVFPYLQASVGDIYGGNLFLGSNTEHGFDSNNQENQRHVGLDWSWVWLAYYLPELLQGLRMRNVKVTNEAVSAFCHLQQGTESGSWKRDLEVYVKGLDMEAHLGKEAWGAEL